MWGDRQVFARVFAADVALRSAYQLGKSPVLPVFAAMLGAGEARIGLIVSVSVAVGLVLKPLVGVASDRWGRRAWLLAATVVFTAVPFLYRFVGSPELLVGVRLLHGTATAIYGPVSIACIAELSGARVAERLGWFGIARSAGYVAGPALGGWMLTLTDPVAIYDLIGLLSGLAFVPLLGLAHRERARSRPAFARQATAALAVSARLPALWLGGGAEGALTVALYAVRTFLPVYALDSGMSLAVAGALVAAQEGVHLLLRPLGGRVADRWGMRLAIGLGMGLVGVALVSVAWSGGGTWLALCFVVMGLGQALVTPSVTALLAGQVPPEHLGAAMGLAGTLRNAAKVAGPILGGALVVALGFGLAAAVTGAVLGAAGAALAVVHFRATPGAQRGWPGAP